jgi:hypothetical protein
LITGLLLPLFFIAIFIPLIFAGIKMIKHKSFEQKFYGVMIVFASLYSITHLTLNILIWIKWGTY